MRTKNSIVTFIFVLALGQSPAFANAPSLESYLFDFDRRAQQDMKIGCEALVSGMDNGKILLLDIRFREEIREKPLGFGKAIPLNELPMRLKEIPTDKLIVTACPVKDRAIIAMVFLKTRGYKGF